MQPLRVALGERAYPIHIGGGLLGEPRPFAPHVEGRAVAIITNEVVAPLYLARLRSTLEGAGARVAAELVLEDGERAKSFATLERLLDRLLAARCGRDCVVIALGGGVIGDLAGFAAAIYQRGVPFVQVPTTLLSQVDSAVGGKTAINHARGKNMIGAFHQPLAVVSDVATLDTLPGRELRAGIAEVLKHGFILDARFVAWLEENVAALLARERGVLEHAVRRCCELKARLVAADEREAGERAILNFGHTFGHAIEAATGYDEWLHGEAVAAGMVMAAELSARAGALAQDAAARVRSLVAAAGLPVQGPRIAVERYLDLIGLDKKSLAGRPRFVVLQAIGRARLRDDLEERWVREAIAACSPQALPAASQ
jgi:3-dehydroquinate synthase